MLTNVIQLDLELSCLTFHLDLELSCLTLSFIIYSSIKVGPIQVGLSWNVILTPLLENINPASTIIPKYDFW